MRDSRTVKPYAARLADYVRGSLQPGQSMRSFCLEHGLDNARISAWASQGGDVSIDSMRDFGDRLGLTLGQVLIIAGYGTPDEIGGAVPPAPVPAPLPRIDDAIARDPELPEHWRGILREIVSGMRAVETGAAISATVRTPAKATRRAKRA